MVSERKLSLNKRLGITTILGLILIIIMCSCSQENLFSNSNTDESTNASSPSQSVSDTTEPSPYLSEKPGTVAYNWLFSLLISKDNADIQAISEYILPNNQ